MPRGPWFEDVEGYDDELEGEPMYEPAPEPSSPPRRGGGLAGVMQRVSDQERHQRGLLEAHEALVREMALVGVEIPGR